MKRLKEGKEEVEGRKVQEVEGRKVQEVEGRKVQKVEERKVQEVEVREARRGLRKKSKKRSMEGKYAVLKSRTFSVVNV